MVWMEDIPPHFLAVYQLSFDSLIKSSTFFSKENIKLIFFFQNFKLIIRNGKFDH